MKNKIVVILVVVAVVLALVIAGALGFVWYRENHIFVEGAAYPINAQSLDLREEDISFYHHDTLQANLPDCYILWNVPFQGNKVPSDTQSLTVSTLTQEDVAVIANYFPYLRTLDASSCKEYALLESLMEKRPEIQVTYQVSLGSREVAPDSVSLELDAQDYDFDTLMGNLVYLHKLEAVKLRMPEISMEQVEQLRAAYENITFTCTAQILGVEYDTETTELDLTGLTAEGVEEVAEKLVLLPELTYVNLEGAPLEKTHVKQLMEAAPNVVFNYSFDFFGTTVSTADEEVVIKNVKIGDENEAEIRLTLDLLTNCKRFVLDSCNMTSEVMAKIRDDYRDRTKVVWRVWFGAGGTSLTDAQIVRAVYDLVDDNCAGLYYLEDARYMDIGHNEWLDGCDFVAGMKSLEYVIISGAPIKSLEPFRNCKNLKFLEVAFCEYLEDASPLAECTKLEMLNISNTHIVDLSPLDNLPLTNLVARRWLESGVASRVSVEEQERFQAANPDCKSYFDPKNPYGEGWRYTEDMKEYLPTYALIRRVFRYEKDPAIPNNVGWYLKDEEQET